jgi:hypothetical protein
VPKWQAGSSHSDRHDTAFFMHMPRTGGTALRHMLEQSYDLSEQWKIYDWAAEYAAINADRATIERFRIVSGHFRIEVWLPFQDKQLLLVVRDPVARYVSEFRRRRSFTKMPDYAQIQGMDIEEFLNSDSGRVSWNHQTYMLSTRVSTPGHGAPDADREIRPVDAQEAIGHISKPQVLAGLTEENDRTVALISVLLDIEPPALVKANQSFGPKVDLSDRVRGQIQDRNALDAELYEAATDLFWDQWRSAGTSATAALEWVRRKPHWRHQLREWGIDRYRRTVNSASRVTHR